MIGKLTGIVDSIGEDSVLLDVNGVGYVVQCPLATLAKLVAGASASLLTEMRVGDDAVRLYGFLSHEERDWFRLLQSVQGVGAKVALAILSTLAPRDLTRALAFGDKAMVGRAPGVGPKLALRIVTELKDKAPKAMLSQVTGPAAVAQPAGAEADALAALLTLGYSQGAAAEAVLRAGQALGEGAAVDALIREALKGMGR